MMNWTNTLNTLQKFADTFRSLYISNLTSNNHIASRDLIDSLRVLVYKGNRTLEINVILNEYWKYIENGTKPHYPPRKKILEWIQVKPVLPYQDSKGKLPSQEALSYMIARKINLYGTQGTGDFQNAFDDTYYKFNKEITDSINEDIRKEIIYDIL